MIDNATLRFNRSDAITFAGNISGTGGLTQAGLGTLILTGTNSYVGGTTIDAGTLQIGDGFLPGSILGDVLDNGSLVFDRSEGVTFFQVVGGTGKLTHKRRNPIDLDWQQHLYRLHPDYDGKGTGYWRWRHGRKHRRKRARQRFTDF